MHKTIYMLEGLRLVGWPLLLGGAVEMARARRRVTAGSALPQPTPLSGPERAIRTASLIVLGLCFVAVVRYALLEFLWRGIDDPVGVSIAAISGWWASGQPIYPDAATIDRYGIFPYGPLLFQLVGVSIKLFGPLVMAAKLFPFCAFAASTVGMYLVLRRARAGIATSLIITQLLVLVEGTLCTWVRPDPFLIGIAVLCCYLVTLSWFKNWTGVVVLAVLAGLASALKFHGVFYVVPALVEVLARDRSGRGSKIAAFIGISATVALLPFFVQGASVSDYLFVLKTTSHGGIFPGILVSNLCFIGTFLLALHALSRGRRAEDYARVMASVIASGVFVSIFAAKGGAGPHHLIPLLPYLGVLLARILDRPSPPGGQRAELFLLVTMLLGFQTLSGTAHALHVMYAKPASLAMPDGLH